jgi:biopolymer transport protein ExbD
MRLDLQDGEEVDVQMAPLIDCVFLLLIFFLVATTLKKIDEELPLTLPDSTAAIEVQQPNNVTVVAIDHSGAFYLDGVPVNTDRLQGGLRAVGRSDRASKIRIDVDRDVPFQRVMEVLDIVRFEQLSNVGINTNQKDRE